VATTAPASATSIAAGRASSDTSALFVPPRTSRGLWRDAWRRLLRNKLALAGLIFISAMVFVAIFADILSAYDPTYQFPASSYLKPSAAHLLGTDDVGRDILSRLIHGARVSLSVAIFVQVLILGIGLSIGGIAGFFGGRVDN
jgi:dipeptide transport system permease protein